MPTPSHHAPASADQPRGIGKVLTSSFIGSMIEGFEFYSYTIGAAAVFATLFFPIGNPILATAASLATLGVGYVVRPLGAIAYGRIGDRFGRKKSLVSSILLMGIATALVGLLPTYQQIGIAAPILLILLRLVQGFAFAGEWGGAVLMALEHAPPNRRGFASALVGAGGLSAGVFLAGVCFSLLALLPGDGFLAWGWRLPFLVSFLLIGIGLWIRLGIDESPVFLQAQEEARRKGATSDEQVSPLRSILRTQPRQFANAFLISVGPYAITSVARSFFVSYAILMNIDRAAALLGSTIGSVVSIASCVAGGWLSDRFGRRPLFVIGAILTAAACVGAIETIKLGDARLFIVAYAAVTLVDGLMMGPVASFMAELFATRSRFTGISLAYQLSSAVGGGILPALAALLLAAGGGGTNSLYVSILFVACCLLTLLVALFSRESYRDSLEGGASRD